MEVLLWIFPKVNTFPKKQRFVLGQQIENTGLEILKLIIQANNQKDKIKYCFVHYEVIKILIRLAKDYKLLNLKQYSFACRELVEVGNLLGGWYKLYQPKADQPLADNFESIFND